MWIFSHLLDHFSDFLFATIDYFDPLISEKFIFLLNFLFIKWLHLINFNQNVRNYSNYAFFKNSQAFSPHHWAIKH